MDFILRFLEIHVYLLRSMLHKILNRSILQSICLFSKTLWKKSYYSRSHQDLRKIYYCVLSQNWIYQLQCTVKVISFFPTSCNYNVDSKHRICVTVLSKFHHSRVSVVLIWCILKLIYFLLFYDLIHVYLYNT